MRFLIPLLLTSGLATATIVVDTGIVRVSVGTASVQVPVTVTGGDAITDMAGVVETGNPPASGPTITAVSYTGSIWTSASGGYSSFFAGAPPAATVAPNVSLNTAGQTVAGNGLLMTLTISTAGLPAGDYPIRFTGTAGGDTSFSRSGTAVAAVFGTGILRIVDNQFESWQQTNFPGSVSNPALEATIWGALADPDRDGLPNLTEFYIGTDPNVRSTAPASTSAPGIPVFSLVTVSGLRYPALTYSRRVLSTPVTAELQSGNSLTTWSSAGFTDVAAPVTLPGSQFELVTRRTTTPVSSVNTRQFLRLKITGQP